MTFHYEILSKKQKETLTIIDSFKNDFFLVGGTAIALQLGHRKSIDFDLFMPNSDQLNTRKILSKIKSSGYDFQILESQDFHYEFLINKVKVTFFAYIYNIPNGKKIKGDRFKTLELIHLAAMKADAIGKRAKWKDYVDLYFLIKKFGLTSIGDYAKEFFGGTFNKKLFYSQIGYFEDIDYSEKVLYMPGFEKTDSEIKQYLISQSKTI